MSSLKSSMLAGSKGGFGPFGEAKSMSYFGARTDFSLSSLLRMTERDEAYRSKGVQPRGGTIPENINKCCQGC